MALHLVRRMDALMVHHLASDCVLVDTVDGQDSALLNDENILVCVARIGLKLEQLKDHC